MNKYKQITIGQFDWRQRLTCRRRNRNLITRPMGESEPIFDSGEKTSLSRPRDVELGIQLLYTRPLLLKGSRCCCWPVCFGFRMVTSPRSIFFFPTRNFIFIFFFFIFGWRLVAHNLPGPQPRLSEKAKGDLDPCNHDLVMAGPSFTPRRLPIYI